MLEDKFEKTQVSNITQIHVNSENGVRSLLSLVNFKPNDEIKKEFDLVFVGNLGYHPNVIAVKYFMGEILPSIILKYPNIKILIAVARLKSELY